MICKKQSKSNQRQSKKKRRNPVKSRVRRVRVTCSNPAFSDKKPSKIKASGVRGNQKAIKKAIKSNQSNQGFLRKIQKKGN